MTVSSRRCVSIEPYDCINIVSLLPIVTFCSSLYFEILALRPPIVREYPSAQEDLRNGI